MIASTDWGGIAAVIAACAWGLLAVFLAVVLINVFRLLESVKITVDDLRKETVPLLGEVRVTVTDVNRELDRVDGTLDSVAKITKTVERVTGLVEQAMAGPLVKIAAAGAGLARAVRRFRGERP